MPGSGEVITMYYALAARLRAVLERCRPGSMQILCGAGLGSGLAFGKIFAPLSVFSSNQLASAYLSYSFGVVTLIV